MNLLVDSAAYFGESCDLIGSSEYTQDLLNDDNGSNGDDFRQKMESMEAGPVWNGHSSSSSASNPPIGSDKLQGFSISNSSESDNDCSHSSESESSNGKR